LGICCLLWIFRRGLFPGFDPWFRSVIAFLGVETESSLTERGDS